MYDRARSWVRSAWACLVVVLAVGVWSFPRCAAVCNAAIVTVDEPQDWRSWPLVDSKSTCRGLCPRRDVPLHCDGTAVESWVRHDPGQGIWVVSGPPYEFEPKERLSFAFRRAPGGPIAFPSPLATAWMAFLAAVATDLALGIAVASARLRASSLRVQSADPGGASPRDSAVYRTSAAPARDLAADRESARAAGERSAIRAIGAAFVALVFFFFVFLVFAGQIWLRQSIADGITRMS